jgi:hypothetical protein
VNNFEKNIFHHTLFNVLLDGVGELHSFVLSDGMDLRLVEVRVVAGESFASFQGNYRK